MDRRSLRGLVNLFLGLVRHLLSKLNLIKTFYFELPMFSTPTTIELAVTPQAIRCSFSLRW